MYKKEKPTLSLCTAKKNSNGIISNNKNEFNNNIYLFTCLLNSPRANYKVNISKRKKQNTQIKGKTRQLVSFRQ
jgi:hypothetical protein